MKLKIKLPSLKFRSPFANPVNLKTIHQRFFGRKNAKVRKKLTWRLAGRVALWGLGAFVLITILTFAWFAKDLPTLGSLKNLTSDASTRLYDRNMNELYTISGEKKRIIVDSNQIPDTVKEATVALEDKNFYHEPGIDYKGVLRAIIFLGKRGGGSTLTQQYVKNALLTSQRTIPRKIKEAILSIELSFLYNKDQILTMYLNESPYGGNNYGIEAAAKSYFGKSAKDLTLAEAATLAALPQRPTTYSPYGEHTDLLIARRNYTLDQMVSMGYIKQADADTAKATALTVVPESQSIVAPHFVMFVKDWLVKYFTSQLGDAQLAETKVDAGGLTVVTSLDLDLQNKAQQIVSDAANTTLKNAKASNAGLVAIDPATGQVLAMVGSVNYNQPQFGAYNIATAARQPGSSFKPVVYATAFKGTMNPATTLFDLKTDFGGGYVPQDFTGTFSGPVTIRYAIGNSLNIPAVKTLGMTGIDKVLKTASDMGYTTLNGSAGNYGLSLALGSGEVTLLDHTAAYGIFANQGVFVPTSPTLKITDTKNNVIYDHTAPKDARQVLDPQIAYEISNMLSDTNAKKPIFARTMGVLTLPDRPVAVKTGTTNANHDAWTMGYIPQIAVGVWAGNNDNSPMNSGGSIAAAPIWHNFMVYAASKYPATQFTQPDGIQTVQVDKLSNKLPVNGSDVISDIFARWQVPTQQDDVHQQVRVCRENGLLADSSISDALAEVRTYTYVHSEMPNNTNWEGPVRAWANANGFNNAPPTQKCTNDNSNSPTVTITSPSSGATVSGNFDIIASGTAPSGVASVSFAIDNTVIATDTAAPYQTSYNASNLSTGSHTIAATVTSVSGSTASTKITVNVSNDTTPPHDIIGFNGTPAPISVQLTWINPSDADFAAVHIYYRKQNSGGSYSSVSVNGSPSLAGSTTISGLTSHVAYEFLAKATDASGNESTGVTIFLTPL